MRGWGVMCGWGACMVVGSMHGWGACMVVGGMCGCGGCACACIVVEGGYVWLWGVCVVVRGGGVWGCGGECVVARGHAWLQGGCMVVGACVGNDEIWSMNGWYTSYWNAFLFNLLLKLCIMTEIEKNVCIFCPKM